MYQEEISTFHFMKSISVQEISRFGKIEPQIKDMVYLSKDSSDKMQCLVYGDAIILINCQDEKIDETGQILYFSYEIRMSLLLLNNMENPEGREMHKQQIMGVRLSQEKFQDLEIFFQHSLSQSSLMIQNLSQKLIRTNFKDRFKPLKRIGQGTFASVYSIKRICDNKQLAAKAFVKQKLFEDEKRKFCVFNEMKILRELDHESIMKFYGMFDSGRTLYFIYELIQGYSLLKLVSNASHLLDHESIAHLLFTFMSGLKYLSKKRIMHRDLKPENIMIKPSKKNRNSYTAVMIDFGFAEYCDSPKYELTRCGTPGFIAPEIIQMKQKTHIEPVCDVFSAGSIFYYMLTKRYLFGTVFQEALQKNKEVSIEIDSSEITQLSKSDHANDLLSKMLEQNPEKRITAEEALQHPYFEQKLGSNYETKLSSPLVTEFPSKRKFSQSI